MEIFFNSKNLPKDSPGSEKLFYICGPEVRIECEHGREHSTHSDRVKNIE